MRFLAFLDRQGIHIHWHDKVEFPPARWPMEFEPRRVCRCGSIRWIGQSIRWFVNTDDEWEYDDGDYGW